MSKNVIEEFDVCLKFMSECIEFVYPLEERKIVQLQHNVACEDFVIFVGYDKRLLGHKINEFVRDMIKEAQESDLYRYHWTVHCPLVEEV